MYAAAPVIKNKWEDQVVPTTKQKSIWDKGWDWIDEHQTEIALGLGVAVGIAAIVITGESHHRLLQLLW